MWHKILVLLTSKLKNSTIWQVGVDLIYCTSNLFILTILTFDRSMVLSLPLRGAYNRGVKDDILGAHKQGEAFLCIKETSEGYR